MQNIRKRPRTFKEGAKEEEEEEENEWSNNINCQQQQQQQYYADRIDIFSFVKHATKNQQQCACTNCSTTNTSINTLLSNVWHSYPFKTIAKTKPDFKKTLLDTPPHKFKLETYLHGSPNRKCSLTGTMCMSYMILKIPLEQLISKTPQKEQCCNCGGKLDCINGESSSDSEDCSSIETEFVIDYKYGKLLPAIRFLANIKLFTQQTPVEMIETVSTNITTSYNELRCRLTTT